MKSHTSDVSLSTNVDVPTRLRRAIHLNDLTLVKRIVKNHLEKLQNPDLEDNGNTSLHLAAKLGFLDIAVSLLMFPLPPYQSLKWPLSAAIPYRSRS